MLSSEFVSRSAYKLWELEEKHRFICPKRKSDRRRIIVELGAAPGGWTQMALEILAKQGKEEVATRPRPPIFALDLLPLSPMVQAMADIEFLQGDFNDPAIRTELTQRIQQWSEGAATRDSDEASSKVDVILSDMLCE
jgi:23S rRNA (uridine2552-2'-O)-methyltransferase